MTDEPNKFTHVGVKQKTQKQIAILARVFGFDIYDLVGTWTNSAWETALKAGLVTDAMLESPTKAHVIGKENIVEFDVQDGKKLLQKIKVKKAVKA